MSKTRMEPTEELVRRISADKKEPKWMLDKRLEGLRLDLTPPSIEKVHEVGGTMKREILSVHQRLHQTLLQCPL